jgi:tRNA A-37 threonylcarbamoyl transferase component Bud32/tetratricopeptide (TPR) repeat protein
MGQVYLAHDPSLERDVALKLLHRDSTGALRAEAKALAALSHPGIVTVFEIGEHDGQDYIAMEYLAGRTLRDVLADKPGRGALLQICAKVARAVAAAHRAGILHRDIKPENVVITDDGSVKVVDFGIARRLSDLTQELKSVTAQDLIDAFSQTMSVADTILSPGTHTVFGTPAYIAPEVLLGERSDEKSDVYSLGVMVYECIVGRRPHDGTLVEVISQVIDGPAPTLDAKDRLAPLVERMLARSPAKRPALDRVAAALSAPEAPPKPRRSKAIPIAIAGVVAAAAGVTAWFLLNREPAPVAAPPPAAVVTASIAIAPLEVVIPSYGSEAPKPEVFAAILGARIGQVEGAKLTAIPLATDDRGGTRTASADYLVTGKIREVEYKLRADFEVVETATKKHVANVRVEKPVADAAPLLTTIAAEVARSVAPAAVLAPVDRRHAQAFFALGEPLYQAGRFTDARPYFEQAVASDPDMFEAWYDLALVLGWMNAPDDRISAVIARAIALAPDETKRVLVRGLSAFLTGDYTVARETLEAIEGKFAERTPEWRELEYYLGDANWHDGRHTEGFNRFKRVLDYDPHFGAAIVHAWQYAVARHDVATARFYVGLGAENPAWPELAAGHYKQLAEGRTTPFREWAQMILDRRTPEIDHYVGGNGLDAHAFRIALAVRDGKLDDARAIFADAWEAVAAADVEHQPHILGDLENLAEVTLTAEMTDETRRVVTFLGAHAHGRARHGAHRVAALAAALLADPSLLPKSGLSDRNTKLLAAASAELSGDRAGAAKILRGLVDDPTFTWDYPERAALVRNLRAMGRHKDAVAVCVDTLHPAVFRAAQVVMQRTCRSIGVTARSHAGEGS